jgi:hypothetical protein
MYRVFTSPLLLVADNTKSCILNRIGVKIRPGWLKCIFVMHAKGFYMYMYIHMYMRVYIRMYMRVYIHTYMRVYIHMYMRVYIRSRWLTNAYLSYTHRVSGFETKGWMQDWMIRVYHLLPFMGVLVVNFVSKVSLDSKDV